MLSCLTKSIPYDSLMPIKISDPSQPWEVIRHTERVHISKDSKNDSICSISSFAICTPFSEIVTPKHDLPCDIASVLLRDNPNIHDPSGDRNISLTTVVNVPKRYTC
ncbi:hypothetical protein Hanom_Chr09g00821091 [Helianthus anomalus]